MKIDKKIILKVTFCISVLTYTLWSPIKERYEIRIFYPGIALTYIGYLYVILQMVKEKYEYFQQPGIAFDARKYSWYIVWVEAAYMAAYSNLLDELFFDPTAISWNEYIAFLLITIFAVYNGRKRNQRRKT